MEISERHRLRKMLFRKQKARCFYCDRPCVMRGPTRRDLMTIDHIVAGNDAGPFVGACKECNEERGHLPAHEYVAVHGMRLLAAERRA